MTGLGETSTRIEFYRFGFGQPFGWVHETRHEILDEQAAFEIEESRIVEGRPLKPHPEFGDALGPLEVVMLDLEPDKVFLDAERLKKALGLPACAEALYMLDQWTQPEADKPASTAEDLVLAVEALRERRAITAALALSPPAPEDYLRERIKLFGGWERIGKASATGYRSRLVLAAL